MQVSFGITLLTVPRSSSLSIHAFLIIGHQQGEPQQEWRVGAFMYEYRGIIVGQGAHYIIKGRVERPRGCHV